MNLESVSVVTTHVGSTFKKKLSKTKRLSISSEELIKAYLKRGRISISQNVTLALQNSKGGLEKSIISEINKIQCHFIEEQFCSIDLKTIIEDIKKDSENEVQELVFKIKFDNLDYIDLKKLVTNQFSNDSIIDFSEHSMSFGIIAHNSIGSSNTTTNEKYIRSEPLLDGPPNKKVKY
jgi:hypothetical protein